MKYIAVVGYVRECPCSRKHILKNLRVREHDECNLLANGEGENYRNENDQMVKTWTISESREGMCEVFSISLRLFLDSCISLQIKFKILQI